MTETAREHVANALQAIYFEYQLTADNGLRPATTAGVTKRLELALREIDAGNIAPHMIGVKRA